MDKNYLLFIVELIFAIIRFYVNDSFAESRAIFRIAVLTTLDLNFFDIFAYLASTSQDKSTDVSHSTFPRIFPNLDLVREIN